MRALKKAAAMRAKRAKTKLKPARERPSGVPSDDVPVGKRSEAAKKMMEKRSTDSKREPHERVGSAERQLKNIEIARPAVKRQKDWEKAMERFNKEQEDYFTSVQLTSIDPKEFKKKVQEFADRRADLIRNFPEKTDAEFRAQNELFGLKAKDLRRKDMIEKRED